MIMKSEMYIFRVNVPHKWCIMSKETPIIILISIRWKTNCNKN